MVEIGLDMMLLLDAAQDLSTQETEAPDHQASYTKHRTDVEHQLSEKAATDG